jgi:serine/threonine-protein kinase
MTDTLSRLSSGLSPRYEVQREVGRGGMATVFLAVDRKHGRQVAIKVLAPEIAVALGPERFLREIEIAARLSHPLILPLHDSGESEGLLYYIMPHVAGESLRERLRRRGPLPPEEAVRIASEVADALSYAHGLGLVHRDVKPDNILLTGDHAVLSDFGVARAVTAAREETLTEAGSPIGTPAYMSPEQAAGSSKVDGRSDVYSLGTVLQEMLAGEAPGVARPGEDKSGASLPEGTPRWLARVIERAREPSPEDRFESAEGFRTALLSQRVPRRARRPAGRTLALASAVGIAAVALGIALLPRGAASLDPERVLVTVLENGTGDPRLDRLGDMATDHLVRGLTETGLVGVLDVRNELEAGETLAQAGPPRELARRLGSGTLLGGRYYRSGDSLFFETQVVDVGTGEARCAVAPAATAAGDEAGGVALVKQRVMACMATLFDPRFAQYEAASPPPSYEAYQELVTGEDLFHQPCGDCPWRALAHVEKAIAIDSTYTAAWTTLAKMSALMGQCDRVREIAGRLDPVYDRLPPYEHAQMEATIAACRADYRSALEAVRSAAAAEPRRAGMTAWIPLFALLLNRPREALAALGEVDSTGGDAWQVAAAYHMLGDHERELEAAERARRAAPDDMLALRVEMVALAALGRVFDVEKRIEERLDQRLFQPYPADGPGVLMVRAGLELRAHGHPSEGMALLQRAVEWYRTQPPDPEPEHRLEAALALYFAGRWEEARTELERALVEDPENFQAQATLGALAARRGDRRRAMEVDAWLASRWRDADDWSGEERPRLTYARASIASLLGERERALSLIRQAFDEGFPYINGGYPSWLEVDPDMDPLRGDPEFQRIMRPKG